MTERLQNVTSLILDGGYYAALPTVGPSMFPIIRAGDKVYIESLINNRPKIGDIILFKCGDKKPPSPQSSPLSGEETNMICHRLVKIFEKDGLIYYRTRGDAFFSKDAPITYDQIIGRVIKVERTEISLMRRILLLLSPLLGRFTLLNAAIVNALMRIKTLGLLIYLFLGHQ